MSEDPVVVVAATPRSWAADLRARAADHGGVIIRATVLTQEDALSEHCAVLLVDDVTSFLTPAFVAVVQQHGRAVLGLYDPTDSQGKSDLIDAGVDALAPADVDAADLIAQVGRLAARRPEDRPSRRPAAAPDPPAAGVGRTIGVAGPTGGVGVTEIAIELAAAMAVAGVPTVLVDAEEVAPSHAQRLGLPLHPNIHTALHAVQRAKPVEDCLHPLARRKPLAALSGMAVTGDWATVSAGAPARLLSALAAAGRTVVADLGHCLPRADGPAGLRFGHAAALAASCDDLVLVTAPTPTAITRTIAMVADLARGKVADLANVMVADLGEGKVSDSPGDSRRLHLVLNRVGADRYVRDESIAELRRATDARVVHVVGEDARVPRAAWQGSRVTRGRFTAQVGTLADALRWR